MKHSKEKNSKTNKEVNKKSKILKKMLIIIIIISLIMIISFLAFKAYTFKTLAKEMFINNASSVYDTNNNIIAQIGSERNYENINFSDIPDNLKNAYISIEDERFFKHHGIDIKRTGAAILSYIVKRGSSSFGGSTITQQLVKNITGNDSNSINRKITEWFYAFTLEATFSKEEILEAYLNIIYTGPNIYGIQEASHYYFNTDINNLSLAQIAFLAGITHSPNSYNPFSTNDRSEKINNRTKTVLNKMLKLGYISQNEFDTAAMETSNGLNFSKGTISNNSTIYSYHTDALINEIIYDLSKSKHISSDFATNYFYMSNSNIYSCQNSDIQKIVENEFKDTKYILKSSNGKDTSQAAIVIIDQSTGYVVSCNRWIRRKKII